MFLGLRKLGNICCEHRMFLNKIRNIFLCPGHKIYVRNKCCARGQTGKHLCRQQCVRNNVSSFARALSVAKMASLVHERENCVGEISVIFRWVKRNRHGVLTNIRHSSWYSLAFILRLKKRKLNVENKHLLIPLNFKNSFNLHVLIIFSQSPSFSRECRLIAWNLKYLIRE